MYHHTSMHTSSTADQTYPKTDTGPNDDNGTAGATGPGLYVWLTSPEAVIVPESCELTVPK